MHFTKVLAFVTFFAGAALAAPAPVADANPPKPPKPSKPAGPVIVQINQCGNGATPYCCNTDNSGKYTTCESNSFGSICSATTVCCNAINSIQTCLGNAVIVNKSG